MKTPQSTIENTRNGFHRHSVCTTAKFLFPRNGEFNTVLPVNLTVFTGEFNRFFRRIYRSFIGEINAVLPAKLTQSLPTNLTQFVHTIA